MKTLSERTKNSLVDSKNKQKKFKDKSGTEYSRSISDLKNVAKELRIPLKELMREQASMGCTKSKKWCEGKGVKI